MDGMVHSCLIFVHGLYNTTRQIVICPSGEYYSRVKKFNGII